MAMNMVGFLVDLALIAVAALILIVNTKRGFLYSLTVISGKLVSLILAFFASRYVNFIFMRPAMAIWSKLGDFAARFTFIPYVISVILAFIVTLIVVRLIFRLIASATSGIGGKLGTLNHVLGFVLGLAIAFVAVQLIAVGIFLVNLVIGVFSPQMSGLLTNGAGFTNWVVENNVLV